VGLLPSILPHVSSGTRGRYILAAIWQNRSTQLPRSASGAALVQAGLQTQAQLLRGQAETPLLVHSAALVYPNRHVNANLSQKP